MSKRHSLREADEQTEQWVLEALADPSSDISGLTPSQIAYRYGVVAVNSIGQYTNAFKKLIKVLNKADNYGPAFTYKAPKALASESAKDSRYKQLDLTDHC